MLDRNLPAILAHLSLSQLSTGISRLKDLAEIVSKENPLKYESEPAFQVYAYKIKHLLTSVALGMMPATAWNGQFDANGGYLVVKKDGGIFATTFTTATGSRTICSASLVLSVPVQGETSMLPLYRMRTGLCHSS